MLLPIGTAVSSEILDVRVRNWPELQTIFGTVEVEGPIAQAELAPFEQVLVTPVRPDQINRLVKAGMLEADGYTSVVLSLAGETSGDELKGGTVGAILLPDTELVTRAFREDGLFLFALEVDAEVSAGDEIYFASEQRLFRLGHPRYQVLLYNTTEKTARVDLYAYLSN